MEEYKILEDDCGNIQMWLNQWRHDYTINIISVSVIKGDRGNKMVMVLTRTKKEAQKEN